MEISLLTCNPRFIVYMYFIMICIHYILLYMLMVDPIKSNQIKIDSDYSYFMFMLILKAICKCIFSGSIEEGTFF